jgi:hypothetical protein
MLARLTAEQRINAPASIEPDIDPTFFEPLE